MKESRTLLYSFLMCVATGCAVYFLVQRQQKKIAVVDAVKLFDQFNLKKELEAKEKVKLEAINKQVDSMNSQLQLARAAQNEDGIKKMSYAYEYIKTQLDNEYRKSNHDINEQVWKRLNAMVEEYGKQKGLHILIGANGMGTVLYNDAAYDLSDELIKFVNKKYEEGN